MAMELIFQHDVAELPKMLAFNYDELKAGLTNYLAKFDGLVVTADAIKAAETDRAEINKVSAAIKRARIDIKKRAFDSFEARAKELEAMCDKASGEIGAQLKAFDEQRKAKKRELIDTTLTTAVTEAFGHSELAMSPVWKGWVDANCARARGAWLNSGVSIETIAAEIDAEIGRVGGDYNTLVSFTEAEPVAVKTLATEAFVGSFNLAAAMERVKAYKDEQRKIAEAEAREAARKAATMPVEASAPSAGETVPEQPPKATKPVSGDAKYTYRLELTGTREQLKALRAFIDANGITYRKI